MLRPSWFAAVLGLLLSSAQPNALAGNGPGSGTAGYSERECALKAASLYNFAKFVEWPEGSFAGHPETIYFCVHGENPFGPVLARTLGAKRVRERRITVMETHRGTEIQGCQLLFLAASQDQHLGEVLAASAGRPVLLIGESPGFAARGGAINLVMQDGKVRFEINPAAASTARLKISSKLLSLATVVERPSR